MSTYPPESGVAYVPELDPEMAVVGGRIVVTWPQGRGPVVVRPEVVEAWADSVNRERAEAERLRALLRDIAIARRGDCEDVERDLDDLPDEIRHDRRLWELQREQVERLRGLLAEALAPGLLADRWVEIRREAGLA